LERHVTSSDVLAAVRSPTAAAATAALMSRHTRAVGWEASTASDRDVTSAAGGDGAPVRSAYDGTMVAASGSPVRGSSSTPDGAAAASMNAAGVEGIAVHGVPRTPVAVNGAPSALAYAGGSAAGASAGALASPAGLPPLHAATPGRRATVDSSSVASDGPLRPRTSAVPRKGERRRSGGGGGGGSDAAARNRTVVVVDTAVGDFAHFTPVTFSSAHDPKLNLLVGRLAPEAVIDTKAEEEEMAQAKEMVRAVTSQLRASGMIVPPAGLADGGAAGGGSGGGGGSSGGGGGSSGGGGGGSAPRPRPAATAGGAAAAAARPSP